MKECKEFLVRGQKDARSRQESLLESLKKQGKQSADNVKSKRDYQEVAQLDQPLSVVENAGFHILIEHLQPQYSFPSRRYVSETALPELHNRVSTKLAEKLKGVPALSFTTEIWNSDVCPMSYLPEERSLFQPHLK